MYHLRVFETPAGCTGSPLMYSTFLHVDRAWSLLGGADPSGTVCLSILNEVCSAPRAPEATDRCHVLNGASMVLQSSSTPSSPFL